jgi:4-hydroxy-tetrahydrodipicolinate reductase
MKIALLGYGKMGQAIEQVAVERGHTIVTRISIENLEDKTSENLKKADVVIEFTGPDSAFDNLKLCIDAGMPVVSGSTGWIDRYGQIAKYCLEKNGGLLYASNFSVGVNIFFALNKKLGELMKGHDDYNIGIREIHHTQKKDAPSGTAITLAEQVIETTGDKKRWVNHPSENRDELVITSERKDPAAGTHIITYTSEIDDIAITHTAHSRKGFATGAVLAAEFLNTSRQGLYNMNDVLGID